MPAKKKADLNALLADAGGSTRKRPAAAMAPRAARPASQPGREGTAPITGHFPENVRAQLKILAVEQRKTMHSLMAEAFNDLFSKYGKPEIAPQDGPANR